MVTADDLEPTEALDGFYQQTDAGIWKIIVKDTYSGDNGKFQSAQIEFYGYFTFIFYFFNSESLEKNCSYDFLSPLVLVCNANWRKSSGA